MNDAPHDHGSDDEFDEPTDDFVRRLLADARAESPMPKQVAARLDDTLAELVAERVGPPAEQSAGQAAGQRAGQATELADVRARRRRRVLVGLGAAAAFVVAAGVALPTLMGSDPVVRSTTTSDEVAAEQGAAGTLVLAAESAESSVQAYVAGLDRPVATPTPVPLRAPLGGAPSELEDTDDAADSAGDTERGTFAAAEAPPTCEEPGDGELHPATYDGRSALLVLTGVDGDRVLARVVLCDADSDGGDSESDGGDSRAARTSKVPVQFVVPQP